MFRRHFFLGTSLLALAGCSCAADVWVFGSLQSGVVIQQTPLDGADPEAMTLLHVTAWDMSTPGSQPIWQAEGKAKVKSLTYGTVPAGMKVVTPAQPLEPGHTYSIGVSIGTGMIFFNPPSCQGGIVFRVNSDGSITPCTSAESGCG